MNLDLSPIELEIAWGRLLSIVEETSAVLVRSAFSEIVREAYDLQCALLDHTGDAVVQSRRTIPPFVAALPATTKVIIEQFGRDAFHDGDVFVTNDPWLGAGQANDVIAVTPAIVEGEVIGYAASVVHWADVGGRPWALDARSIYEDGILIPPIKAVSAGVEEHIFLEFVRANVRVPDQVIGDFRAQVAANALMVSRLRTLLRDYGLGTLAPLGYEIKSRSERAMREALFQLPDGRYEHVESLDGPGQDVELRLAIVIDGDSITLDFTGSSPEQPWAGNSVTNATRGYAMYGVAAAIGADIPANSGMMRPIEVIAPEGTIVNVRRPGAVNGRNMTSHFLPAAVLQCFAQIDPRIAQAGSGSLWVVNLLGSEDGRTVGGAALLAGGLGALARTDGLTCICFPAAVQNTPVEVIEHNWPVSVRVKRIRRASGGAGAQRGGDGQEMHIEITGDRDVVLSGCLTRLRNPAPGILGGQPGKQGEVMIDGVAWDGIRPQTLRKGQLIVVETPGGGGYGHSVRTDR